MTGERTSGQPMAERLSLRMRRRRFGLFRWLLAGIEGRGPITVLDVGGTADFWANVGFVNDGRFAVTILNRAAHPAGAGFVSVVGDATDMHCFADGQFDVAFSNSVIEHVGGPERQRRFADEVRRVGRRYFVQTPNKLFPIEPHFRAPLFQFLPLGARAWLVRHFALGCYRRTPDPVRARQHVESVRMLTARELAALFPEATILRERFMGLTKSLIAYHGWETV